MNVSKKLLISIAALIFLAGASPLDNVGVVGPGASSTDNAIVRWDGVSGSVLQNSTATIDDAGNLTVTIASGNARVLVDAVLGGADEAQLELQSGADITRLFFRDNDNNFGIFHLNTTRFRIASDGTISMQGGGGDVGIGTLAPGAQLEVRGSAVNPGDIRLTSSELSVVSGEVFGRLDFQAPDEADGSDAVLVAASIYAEAEANFTATANTTALVFATATSEVALEKMRLTGDGDLVVLGQIGTTVVFTDVDGVGSFTVVRNVIVLTCTGPETITTIIGGVSGQLLTMLHEDSDCTLNDTDDNTADQLDLNGTNGDLVGVEDLVIQLVYNGVHWLEVGRSQN